jgi:integrase
MGNVRFNIDKGYLFCVYHFNGHRLKMSMAEKINKKDWSNKMQKVKASHNNYQIINDLIINVTVHIDKIRIEYKIKGVMLTPEVLKNEIKNRIYGSNNDEIKSYVNVFLSSKEIKDSTLKSYRCILKTLLKMYPGLRFDDINKKWYDHYLSKMKDKSINYKYKILKVFKDLMKQSHIEGLHNNIFYNSSLFKIKEEKVDNIYLSIDDINIIYDNINKFDDRLRNAAVIFLIGCFSGQRHQTYSILKKGMISIVGTKEMISIVQEKTQNRVSIPLSPKLKYCLDIGYKPISQQKLNQYIKEVCMFCGIVNYDKVTTHTARRSFATNAVLAGIDITYIMKITGHKTEKEFRKYVNIDDIMSATKVSADISALFY